SNAQGMDSRRQNYHDWMCSIATKRLTVDVRHRREIRSYWQQENAGVLFAKESIDGHHERRAWRAVAGSRPTVVGWRQVEEPRREFRKIGVRARHNRRARWIRRAPVGARVPTMRRAGAVLDERLSGYEPRAPAILSE